MSERLISWSKMTENKCISNMIRSFLSDNTLQCTDCRTSCSLDSLSVGYFGSRLLPPTLNRHTC